MERDPTGSALTAEPLPQVAFRKFGETEWKWFLEKELDQTKDWERYRTDADTKIVGKPDIAVQRLADKLTKMGIVFKKRRNFEKRGGHVEVLAEAVLDEIIFRGVAKIGFNFLAYLKGPDFVLRPEFDPIRNFIRYGTKPPLPPVLASNFAILHADDAFYRQTNGHIIVLDWDRTNTGIVCLLSLFNHQTYHVILCAKYLGVWHPLSGGRHFDVKSMTISEVKGFDRTLYPAW
ncbi:MAG: hypothetical protein WAM91_13365 [Candidatus Acidiferrales bacterium]